jgi:hypothetical protein
MPHDAALVAETRSWFSKAAKSFSPYGAFDGVRLEVPLPR